MEWPTQDVFLWQTTLSELAGLMEARLGPFWTVALAAILGAVVGWEREASGKAAGLRTNILISAGAALFSLLSLDVASASGIADRGRIAAQVVSGVGFLGAGSIIQSRGSVEGLTTAATIWVVAAIGMACGVGRPVLALGITALAMLVLVPLSRVEGFIARRRRSRKVRVWAGSVDTVETVLEHFGAAGLELSEPVWNRAQDGEVATATVVVRGREDAFRKARAHVARWDDVRRLRVR